MQWSRSFGLGFGLEIQTTWLGLTCLNTRSYILLLVTLNLFKGLSHIICHVQGTMKITRKFYFLILLKVENSKANISVPIQILWIWSHVTCEFGSSLNYNILIIIIIYYLSEIKILVSDDLLIGVRKTLMLEITEFKLKQGLISVANAIEQRL